MDSDVLRAVSAWLALPVETWPYEVLQAWQKATLPIVQAMANADLIEIDGWEACHFCTWDAYKRPKELGHESDCPVIVSGMLLAESEASESE